MTNYGLFMNLKAQFDRLYKHNRQGSIQTKYRYREAFLRFLCFLADVYRLEKLANVAHKHLEGYVQLLIKKKCSVAYLKTELAAIRFFHDQIPGAKHQLPTNTDLNLGRRKYGGIDRTWSCSEFSRAIKLAQRHGREDYAAILHLARYNGLRLHECFRLNTNDVALAAKTGRLVVKGKGGLVREIPLDQTVQSKLQNRLGAVRSRGCKLFVAPDDKTHLAMHRFEQFLHKHKAEIQDAGSTKPLTIHGLRHTYAVEQYQKFIAEGMTEKAARLAVANLLGHDRDCVTKVYLASLDDNQKGGDA